MRLIDGRAIAAAGRAGLIGAGHIKPGAIVIDVGANPGPDGGLVGDVDQAGAEAAGAAALTPVPGGVGPVTTMVLMRQVAQAAAACWPQGLGGGRPPWPAPT